MNERSIILQHGVQTQANKELWEEINSHAEREGKYVYTIINEAFSDLLEKHKHSKPRREIMEHFAENLEEYESLYKKLAE